MLHDVSDSVIDSQMTPVQSKMEVIEDQVIGRAREMVDEPLSE